MVIATGFTFKQFLEDGGWSVAALAHLLVILPLSAGIAWFVWTEQYFSSYLRVVRVFAPLLGIMVGGAVAAAAARGQAEELAMLTLLILALFFFMGLQLWPALLASVATLVAFAVVATVSAMPPGLFVKSLVFLLTTTGLAIVIYWDVEQSYRKRFLEEALIGELVERDPLTGLKNRRAFDEHLARIWQQSLRDGPELAVLYVDIDHFKRYNDEYGHQAGDVTLRRVAQVVKGFAGRPLDMAARLGGEEFAVALYAMTRDSVDDVAERLRRGVEQLAIEHRASDCATYVTISVGVAIVEPQIGRTPSGLLQLADQALYQAKEAGRNRCVIEGKEEYRSLVTGAYRNPKRAPHNERRTRQRR